ncbi:hypothetical protein ABBQ38_006238 [Trebouxia sp. C0009 RCD-2024]
MFVTTRDALPLRKESRRQRLLSLSQQNVLQTHQRTGVAAPSSQPYIAGVTSRAKTATAEARQCEEPDPSCSASTLSSEKYASLLKAAMCYPDKQVGLCVAAMVSCGLAAGFRSDDFARHQILPGVDLQRAC